MPVQFQHEEFGNIRVIEIDGEPWFVGKDMADALGYKNSRKALNDHVDGDDVTNRYPIPDALGRTQHTTIINESGMYSLILSSKLPSAKEFKRWVTSSVLPSIRKRGAYITDETLDRILDSPLFATNLFQVMAEERKKNKELNQRLKDFMPKVSYHDAILMTRNAVPISVIAKDYGMSAMAFNRLLGDMEIQYKVGKTWLLRQQYAAMGYTKSRTYYVNETIAVMHTQWTQKGRLFLYEKLKEYDIWPLMEQ